MEENRIEKAKELFKSGFNCAQSVFAAYASDFGLTQEQALKVAASFGGGIGRMRETCGAACGLFMLVGMKTGATDPADREGKSANYKIVQELAKKFKERNGSIKCAELLELRKNYKISHQAEERTEQYYAERPCLKMVESAALLWEEYISAQH